MRNVLAMAAAVLACICLDCGGGAAWAQSLGRASAGFGARAGATPGAPLNGFTTGSAALSAGATPGPGVTSVPLTSTELSGGLAPLSTAPTFLSILGAASSAATGLPTTLSTSGQ